MFLQLVIPGKVYFTWVVVKCRIKTISVLIKFVDGSVQRKLFWSDYILMLILNTFSSIESDGLISQALLTGNFEAAVEVCFQCDRMVGLIN